MDNFNLKLIKKHYCNIAVGVFSMLCDTLSRESEYVCQILLTHELEHAYKHAPGSSHEWSWIYVPPPFNGVSKTVKNIYYVKSEMNYNVISNIYQ